MNSDGKSMLKGSGVGLIIVGALYIVCTIIVMAVAAAAMGALGGAGAAVVTMVIGIIAAVISGGIELIAGIFAVKNADKPEKSKTCLVWGIVVVVLSGLSVLSSLGNISWTIIFPIATVILGVVMILGANKNKIA